MTGREVINLKLAQIRKFIFLALILVPIIFGVSLFFSKHSVINSLSVMLPSLIGASYSILLFYRLITVPCPFCDKKIPCDFKKNNFTLLSDDYNYCPYCQSDFDKQVNEESIKNGSEDLQKMEIPDQNKDIRLTGRDAINATIPKKRIKCVIASIVIISLLFGIYRWSGINTLYIFWMVSFGYCFIITLFIKVISWSACPFCSKRISLSITESDKWKLGMDFLFCQHCGTSIDQELNG